ncbi:MAG: 50S ribosomal protein L15 [Alphaproteobacteria bacterium]|nr:50S ribosomal protein L15 [Alphaproteobacteria bacterium]
MKLNQLKPNEGATKNRMRVGRGIGSGKGKTAGRGVKGQKARTGVSIKGFEGGQTPLYMRMPKRGFNNVLRADYAEITLRDLQKAIDSKKLDAKGTVTDETLQQSGVIKNIRDGVRLVGTGALKSKVELSFRGGATAGAKAAVEKAGGSFKLNEAKTKSTKKAEGAKPYKKKDTKPKKKASK